MARITDDPRRPDRIIVDHYDAFGRRKRPSFPKTPEGIRAANLELAIIRAQGRADCAVSPDITLADYAERWLADMTRQVRGGLRSHNTVENYERMLRLHVLPTCGWMKVQSLTRQKVQTLLDDRAERSTCSRGHLGQIYSAISSMLSSAVDDGILASNPLFRMGGKKSRRNDESHHVKRLDIKAMEREERDAFLDAALAFEPAFYPPLATLAYAGLRLGELRGLRREDVRLFADPPGLRVERQVYDKRNSVTGKQVGPPKSEAGRRTVDLPDVLGAILRPVIGRPGNSPWLWFESAGEPTLEEAKRWTLDLRAAMARVLEKAGLPGRFTPHHLRHTFACLIITQQEVRTGDLLLYLAQQLGHDSITITARIYAHWLKQRSRAIANAGAARAAAPSPEPPAGTVLPFRK